MMRARLAGVLGAALLVLATTSIARADEDDPNAWHLAFTPYFWAAGMYGDVTVKGVNAQPDASFIDLLDDTDTLVGLQGHLEVTRGRFGVYGDFFYVRTKVEDAGAGKQGVFSCQNAITYPQPYRKWTDQMIAVLGDSQEITFGFYYQ